MYRWRGQALNQKGLSATTKYKNIEFSEYCRKKGIYPEQAKEWKEACMNANQNEKELAETAALLVA